MMTTTVYLVDRINFTVFKKTLVKQTDESYTFAHGGEMVFGAGGSPFYQNLQYLEKMVDGGMLSVHPSLRGACQTLQLAMDTELTQIQEDFERKTSSVILQQNCLGLLLRDLKE